MRNGKVPSSADPIAPETLGFEDCPEGWRKTVGGRPLRFARLRSRLDLTETERLQQTVFGVSDRDLISSSILVTAHETGGEVLGAFDGERLVGFVSGWAVTWMAEPASSLTSWRWRPDIGGVSGLP